MADRIVMSSNSVDSHGEVMTKEALEGAVQQINGARKLHWNMNHRRELPPLGRIVDARIETKDKLVLLTAVPEKFQHRKLIEWEGTNLILESFEEETPFISRYDEELDGLSISLDPSNFSSDETFERFNNSLYRIDKSVNIEMHGRKSDIPAPEIIFGISKLIVLYKFLEPFTKKILEKLGEDVYVESKKQLKAFANYVARVSKATRENTIPKNKKLTIIFEIHSQPFIELIVKTDDAAILSKALSEKKLAFIQTELTKFCNHFSVDKIQFKLSDKGNWKFNYLLTTKGDVIGDQAAFKERDKQYQRYELQNSTFSRCSSSG
jgi:hypothetical protein